MTALPRGWAAVEVGAVLNLVNGFAFKPSHWGKSGLPIIRIQNLNDPEAPFNYYDGTLPEKLRVSNDDLLFAWSGTPGTSFGAHLWNGGDAWLNQHIFLVHFDYRLFDKSFLRHAINQNLNHYISEAHGGAGLAHITKAQFEASTLRIAPLSEQQRLVVKLEELLSRASLCYNRIEKISLSLKRFRQSVLAAACSGRLTADWRGQSNGAPSHGGAGALSNDLPLGWRDSSVGEIIDDLKYGTSQKCGYEKRGVPVLRIPNVVRGLIDHGDLKYAELPAREQQQLHLLPGDILIVRSNGSVSLVGTCALVGEEERGFSYAGYLIRIRPNRIVVSPEFLNLALRSYEVRLQIELEARSTSGVNNINSDELRALQLPLPPLDEQEEIVRRVNGFFALADKIETRYRVIQHQLSRLPQSILAKAFRGELVLTEAELAEREGRPYESAEQLLQRIRFPL